MEKTTTQELLAQAEKLCAQRNVRLTPQRLEVLRLMSLQQGAISAYDLLDLLRETEPQAKPPTIYRALDFLLEQGFVHKVESTNSYVVCHLFDQPTHSSAMFICDRCGVVKEECAEGVEDIMHTLAAKMKEQWGKLTDDDMTVIEGKRDQLVGKIQERYGYQKDQAEKEVVDWETRNNYRW